MTNSMRSRYTPSTMQPQLLEQLYVDRDGLLATAMGRIENAAISSERNHSLIVGRRGSGKTHLVSLIEHHISELCDDGGRVQAAWLTEDPYFVASYEDLLVEIITALDLTLHPDADSHVLEHQIMAAYQQDGLVVVMAENLDQILHAIGADGQAQFRHFLQSEPAVLVVATTTAVTRDLADEASPFFGFFTTTNLEPLDVAQAQEMLTKIAEFDHNQSLVDYLQTDEGFARLRAIEHLAGGQPRIWSLLAGALTVDGLSELVGLLSTEIDLLTPYYQEQLGRLSPQQRRIVLKLGEIQHAVTVGELASELRIDQKVVAAAISELKDRRWVSPTSSPFAVWLDRRKRYYEISEPLARLAFQTKKARGAPIPLIVDFMKTWYDPSESEVGALAGVDADYLASFLEHDGLAGQVRNVVKTMRGVPGSREPALEMLAAVDDALQQLTRRDPTLLLGLATPVRTALEDLLGEPAETGFASKIDATRSKIFGAAAADLAKVDDVDFAAWISRAEQWLETASSRATALVGYSRLLGDDEQFDAAVDAIAAIERIAGDLSPEALISRVNLGSAYAGAGRPAESIDVFMQVASDYERVVGPDHPETLEAWGILSIVYIGEGRFVEAVDILEKLAPATQHTMGPDHSDTAAVWSLLALSYRGVGRIDEAIDLEEDRAAYVERTLGLDNPQTLMAWSLLAQAYRGAGRFAEAMAVYEKIAPETERVLGSQHPLTLGDRRILTDMRESS